MSDLISRSQLIEIIKGSEQLLDLQKDECIACINSCDIAYDIDKVVADISEIGCDYEAPCKRQHSCNGCDHYIIRCEDAIEIVKQGGVSDDVCEWKQLPEPYQQKGEQQ